MKVPGRILHPLILIAGILVVATGCTHPCDALKQRLCADLGAEGCATFEQAPTQFGGFVPDRYGWSRRYNGINQCQMFGDDQNYAAHVLPQVRYIVALKNDPNTPRPQLRPIDATAGGVTGNWLYAVGPLCLVGMGIYFWYMNRGAKRAG